MIVQRDGLSMVLFICEAAEERQWLVDNVESEDYQWMGEDVLAVEARYAGGLIQGVEAAAFAKGVRPE